jgi:CRP/FNR family cyclic AMP-dependent transcriptional regulator
MITFNDDSCALLKTKLSFFHFSSKEEIAELSKYFTCGQVKAGDTLWQEGDEADYQAFIVEGEVQIKKETEFAGKHVVVGIYSSGSVVGELCIVDEQLRAVTAVATKDTSLLILSRARFDDLLIENPELGCCLLKGILLVVSIRLRKSFDRLSAIF